MKKVRLGIIGMGNMGTGHLDHTLTGRTPEIEVTAVADTNPARLEATRALLNKPAGGLSRPAAAGYRAVRNGGGDAELRAD